MAFSGFNEIFYFLLLHNRILAGCETAMAFNACELMIHTLKDAGVINDNVQFYLES